MGRQLIECVKSRFYDLPSCRSLGMLLGYHLLWSTTASVAGTDEQKERIQKLIIENNYFVGGMKIPGGEYSKYRSLMLM